MGEDGDDESSRRNRAAGYGALLEDIKSQVRTARVHAARRVNTELILLYWKIGKLIRARQSEEGWGTRVIARLADDLRAEFPGMRGLSQRNLVYMRTLATEYPDPIAQHPAAQLPWGHILVLLDRLPDPRVRDWYAGQAAHHGWSRATLVHHISSDRHLRVGAAPNNFPTTLPAHESDLAHEILQDPYNLDFLGLDAGYSERDLEDALIGRLTHFLTELVVVFPSSDASTSSPSVTPTSTSICCSSTWACAASSSSS